MRTIIISALALAMALSLFTAVHSNSGDSRDTIFQTSTIGALMAGDYSGTMTFGELRRQGDFGLGTFNDLDGEMIGVDGTFYQVKSDGRANVVPERAKTPFATVTFFEADKTLSLDKPLGCKELKEFLDTVLPTKNILYAIKIEGSFGSVKTRSVPKQTRPYPPLTEVVKHESVFELKNIKGTMAGFRLPEYLAGINTTGYHMHFISRDKEAGGHVLDCTASNVSIGIDYSNYLQMSLPETTGFYNADLKRTDNSKVNKVENKKN